MSYDLVFGLSIDDELTCGFAEVSTKQDVQGCTGSDSAFPGWLWVAKLDDLPNTGLPHTEPSAQFDNLIIPIADLIHKRLGILRQSNAEFNSLLGRVKAVGVSSIGLIDRQQLVLRDVRRKPWHRSSSASGFLDIRGVVERFFGRPMQISAHNDATAKCMAYRRSMPMDRTAVLCNLMMSQGVNIGVASNTAPLSVSDMHPEMGHSYPVLHDSDRRLDQKDMLEIYSGCPTHIRCYEGIASGARLDHHRAHPPKLEDEYLSDPDLKDILADYLGQLCWTLTLSVAPSQIVLSGSAMKPKLLQGTRNRFMELNRGSNGEIAYLSAPAYPALHDNAETFIQMAPVFEKLQGRGIRDPDGLMGAFEVGRMLLVSGG